MSCGLGWPFCPDGLKPDDYFKPGHDPGIKSPMPDPTLCKYCQQGRFSPNPGKIACSKRNWAEVEPEEAAKCADFDDWRRYMGKGAGVSMR